MAAYQAESKTARPADFSQHLATIFARQAQAQLGLGHTDQAMELLQQARALLAHKNPEGRLELIFEEALKALIKRKDPRFWPEPRSQQSSSTRRMT